MNAEAHHREWRSTEPSADADRVWRAIEVTHDRIEAVEERSLQFRADLPSMMAEAVAQGIRSVIEDQTQRNAFWQSGVEHVGSLMKRQAGGTVFGLLWSAVKLAAVALLVLVTFGPASVKALIAGWWSK